jgi:hypothetical protein
MRMTATGVVCSTCDVLNLFFELNYGASRLSPVDTIISRMGAYDNMFSKGD